MDRKTFIFYESYMTMGQKIKDKSKRCDFYESIFNAALRGDKLEDTGNPLIDMAYIGIRPLIEANIRNYENGCKGGAPEGNQNAKKQPKNNRKTTTNQPKSTEKQRYKDVDKDKDDYSDKDSDKDDYKDKDVDVYEDKEKASPTSEPEGEVDYDEMSWFDRLEDDRDKE